MIIAPYIPVLFGPPNSVHRHRVDVIGPLRSGTIEHIQFNGVCDARQVFKEGENRILLENGEFLNDAELIGTFNSTLGPVVLIDGARIGAESPGCILLSELIAPGPTAELPNQALVELRSRLH